MEGTSSAAGPAPPSCLARLALAASSRLRSSIATFFSSMTFSCFLRNLRLGLFLPFMRVFTSCFWRSAAASSAAARRASSCRSFCTSFGARRTLPMASGSSTIMLGCSFSSSCTTSASCRCFFVWYGLATNESKLGSPAPGTSSVVSPPEWPPASTSSYGQNRSPDSVPPVKVWLMYGPLAFSASASFHTCTRRPKPTASIPFWLMSRYSQGACEKYACCWRSMRTSHTFTWLSAPAVAMNRPVGSTASARTGPRCVRSLTTGVVMLGVHMVTVPLAWPSAITAFHGFCRMTLHGPSRVRWLHTICPVVVSW
mmetsp:Transcript_40997/g.104862  ORF Transcript_40997/g.104862 Transcript_40997/m.104862 type:complete len:312 (+) Transcript_40997:148-1083(+)